jgi:hypothetical protein
MYKKQQLLCLHRKPTMHTNTLNIVKQIMVTREKKRHLLRAAVLVGAPDAHRQICQGRGAGAVVVARLESRVEACVQEAEAWGGPCRRRVWDAGHREAEGLRQM